MNDITGTLMIALLPVALWWGIPALFDLIDKAKAAFRKPRLSTGEQMIALYHWRSGNVHLLTPAQRAWING